MKLNFSAISAGAFQIILFPLLMALCWLGGWALFIRGQYTPAAPAELVFLGLWIVCSIHALAFRLRPV